MSGVVERGQRLRPALATVQFGTLASWLVDVVNALTGNLDRPGGAMFAKVAVGAATIPTMPADRACPTGGRPRCARARAR